LPHATDLRQVRFLFLPPEHDPDSFVRELGAEAFEQAIEQATPLSRQLLAQAAADGDLETAEGRARMLAMARPLWAALPDGALQRQLLGDLARAAQLTTEDLGSMWQLARPSASVQRPPARSASAAAPSMKRSHGRGAGRVMPTGSADLALRLLLRHADWWDRLGADDHQLLHDLGGEHGALVAWLEQHITDQGPQTWAALDEACRRTSCRRRPSALQTQPRWRTSTASTTWSVCCTACGSRRWVSRRNSSARSAAPTGNTWTVWRR
jgi:DNA primase